MLIKIFTMFIPVSTFNGLESELFCLQFPVLGGVSRCANVMASDREIWISSFRGPCIEREGNFGWEFLLKIYKSIISLIKLDHTFSELQTFSSAN